MDLAGRVAIVTGGGTGIGRSTCIRLARAGAKAVVVNYSRSVEDAESTAADVQRLGTEAMTHHANIADEAMVKAMIAAAVDAYGQLDLLVNNAGTTHFIPFADLDALTDEVWDDILELVVGYADRHDRELAERLQRIDDADLNAVHDAVFEGQGRVMLQLAELRSVPNWQDLDLTLEPGDDEAVA